MLLNYRSGLIFKLDDFVTKDRLTMRLPVMPLTILNVNLIDNFLKGTEI